MKEESLKITINAPLITELELLAMDNYLNEIVKEITELRVHDKDLALSQEIIKRLQQRIDNAYIEFYDLIYHQIGYKYDLDETDNEKIKNLLDILKGEK